MSTSPPPTTDRRRRRRFIRSLRLLGITLLVWVVVSWVVAYRLTRRPRARFDEPVPTVSWAKVEPHRFTTRDGQQLGAWYIPGREDAPAVLLLHGNRGSRGNCLSRAEMMTSRGCPVLMVSLRAHGDSSGEYNDLGYGARHDVIAAIEYLERRCPGRPILIHGTSMGGAAAIFASRELAHRVKGYILESPYQDLKTAVWNRLEDALPPVLDWVAYRGLLTVSPLMLPHLDRVSPSDAIGGIPDDVPVLILAGDRDSRARPAEARALFDRVKLHGELQIFPDADHLEMMGTDPDRFQRAVVGFLNRLAPKPG